MIKGVVKWKCTSKIDEGTCLRMAGDAEVYLTVAVVGLRANVALESADVVWVIIQTIVLTLVFELKTRWHFLAQFQYKVALRDSANQTAVSGRIYAHFMILMTNASIIQENNSSPVPVDYFGLCPLH